MLISGELSFVNVIQFAVDVNCDAHHRFRAVRMSLGMAGTPMVVMVMGMGSTIALRVICDASHLFKPLTLTGAVLAEIAARLSFIKVKK